MTLRGAVLCRLILILALVGNAFADEDNCQGKNTKHLAKFLSDGELSKLKGHIESKALLTQLVQSSLDLKTELVQSNQDLRTQLVQSIQDLKSQLVQCNLDSKTQLRKIEQLVSTLELVKTKMQEIQIATKVPDCERLLQWGDVKKENLISTQRKHFYFYNQKIATTWYTAQNWCQEREMRQASLKTSSIVQEVTKELKKRISDSHWFWLSANDIGHTPGHFRWVDGTQVDKALWRPGAPNKFSTGKQTCVSLYTPQAKLFDGTCAYDMHILCELPPTLLPCLQ